MSEFSTLLKDAQLFDGELEAIEDEFCGNTARPLALLPPAKLSRIREYLKYPADKRQAAFDQVREWAAKPIAAALDVLKNPAKYQQPIKGDRADALSAIESWLEE